MTGRNLVALRLKSTSNYEQNLHTLVELSNATAKKSILLAPEVFITGFDYPNFEEAALFSKIVDQALCQASKNRTIILTLIEKIDKKFFNVAKVYHHGIIIHTQRKYKIFTLGDEKRYFSPGLQEDIKIFQIDDLKVAILICFELRFTQFWQKILGADIILLPAQWGDIRIDHFRTLAKSLAIANQCYVIASDGDNEDTTKLSAIITPFGKAFYNQTTTVQTLRFQMNQIQKMRRYLDIGIEHG